MKCPNCEIENREEAKFCLQCGNNLELKCAQCNKALPLLSKFCDNCGHKLDEPPAKPKPIPLTSDSERKNVTVLFSDLSGYTAMTEKLDPEEVKEIMGRVFGEIAQVVVRYEGFIEKFIGDAVMALFGIPQSHEDDPVRAIKAAREIHDIVSSFSPQYEKRIGKPLAMHTGICTGLVVTGEVNLEKGTHGVLGDTINLASRLSGLAKPGNIVVSPDTYHQAEGYFTCEPMEPTIVKGKVEPVCPYMVLSPKEEPTKTHRLSGLRAELIGRKAEMAQLMEAVASLKQGRSSIFPIVGDAGTGKSRLIEEFKASLDLSAIQWREGHAYAYSQNIPYFPLMDLLSRAWGIQEGDSPDQLKRKVEAGSGNLLGERKDLIPYLGSLYSIKYPEIENVGPEYWKARIHDAVQLILTNLCRSAPAIICIEDLHWADPSSVELLRNILSDFRHPVIFLCIYRPSFSLFTVHQAKAIRSYQEIRLQDLSASDAQNMLESLLKTDAVPADLKRFIRDKVEGNPFYLEEVINSLLETATLVKQDESWILTKHISEANIPSTVQGVISARLDRLETESKRILQEASVIGRAFFYEILRRITTELKDRIDKSLMGLERLDLIRTRALQPDLEYIFKHALTQEVVYKGLLRKERQNIHEKIGQVMEEFFQDRLPEFYETLAYHFKQGHSIIKAVQYLMQSGKKSLSRYSIDESHQYFQEAYNLLINKQERTKEENYLLLEVILDWALVYSRGARFADLTSFLKDQEELFVSTGTKTHLGMFYVRLGAALTFLMQLTDSINYLRQALTIGEEIGDEKVIGYACAYLIWGCADHGLLDDAIGFGKRVQQMEIYAQDLDLHRWAGGLSIAYALKGETGKSAKLAQELVDYGQRHSHTGQICDGYSCLAYTHITSGDYASAISACKKALQYEVEPFTYNAVKQGLGYSYAFNGQSREAQIIFDEADQFVEETGLLWSAMRAKIGSSLVMVMKGNLSQGFRMFEELLFQLKTHEVWTLYCQTHYMMGKIYLKMAQGEGDKSLSLLAKNIGFFIKTIPFVKQKAEEHLGEAINVARKIGAKGFLGQAYVDMGELFKIKGENGEARKYIADAIQLFEECENDFFLKQARETLAALG